MLEGDNMYTCSQCNKKVRAEKRACFKKLPKILAFNTMRYTFNMITMLKEKVNTHFSFPMMLDMSPYMEHNLIPNDKEEMSGDKEKTSQSNEPTAKQQECSLAQCLFSLPFFTTNIVTGYRQWCRKFHFKCN